MHGAHPGHLAFKLLDRRPLSPATPFIYSLSLVSSLSHVFQRTCAASDTSFLLSSVNAQLPPSLFISQYISLSSPTQFSRLRHWISRFSRSIILTLRLLIFYSSSWHCDKNAHVLPYSLARGWRATWRVNIFGNS